MYKHAILGQSTEGSPRRSVECGINVNAVPRHATVVMKFSVFTERRNFHHAVESPSQRRLSFESLVRAVLPRIIWQSSKELRRRTRSVAVLNLRYGTWLTFHKFFKNSLHYERLDEKSLLRDTKPRVTLVAPVLAIVSGAPCLEC
jgi:hypothetical protein